MAEHIDDGGPAFPVADFDHQTFTPKTFDEARRLLSGMSLRDYFAARAGNPPEWWLNAAAHAGRNPRKHEGEFSLVEHARVRAEWAYMFADAMLKARSA